MLISLGCQDSTYLSIGDNSLIVNLKIKCQCHFQYSDRHFFGSDLGELYIYDDTWNFIEEIQYKDPIYSIVADSKSIFTAHGLAGVFRRKDGVISNLWSDYCLSLCFDPYSLQIVASFETSTSIKHYIFSDPNQPEIRHVSKPPGLISTIMQKIGIEKSKPRLIHVMSILDLGNFIDVEEEMPMYTIESSLIITVFDNLVQIYNISLDSIQQIITSDSHVTCISTWNDHMSQFLGIMTEKDYTLYQYKLF